MSGNEIKVGTILVEGFARPHFYEVVGMTPSGKSATVREMRDSQWDSGEQSGTTTPISGSYVSRPFTCRLTKTKNAGVKIGGQMYAFVWDGKARDYYPFD